jgi:hypothetical protein
LALHSSSRTSPASSVSAPSSLTTAHCSPQPTSHEVLRLSDAPNKGSTLSRQIRHHNAHTLRCLPHLVAGYHTRSVPPTPFPTTLTVSSSPSSAAFFSYTRPWGFFLWLSFVRCLVPSPTTSDPITRIPKLDKSPNRPSVTLSQARQQRTHQKGPNRDKSPDPSHKRTGTRARSSRLHCFALLHWPSTQLLFRRSVPPIRHPTKSATLNRATALTTEAVSPAPAPHYTSRPAISRPPAHAGVRSDDLATDELPHR